MQDVNMSPGPERYIKRYILSLPHPNTTHRTQHEANTSSKTMGIKYGAIPAVDQSPAIASSQLHDRGIEMPFDDASPTFRNPVYALLFVSHLVGMGWLGHKYGTFGLDDELETAGVYYDHVLDTNATSVDDGDGGGVVPFVGEFVEVMIVRVALPCGIFAYAFAFLVSAYVLPWSAAGLVRIILSLSFFITAGLSVALSCEYPFWYTYAASSVLSVLVLFFTCKVWHHVPFASANLKVGIKGMTDNRGIYTLALLFSTLAFVWGICWFYVFNGVWELRDRKEGYGDDGDDGYYDVAVGDFVKNYTWIVIFLLLVSLYWTIAVILVRQLYPDKNEKSPPISEPPLLLLFAPKLSPPARPPARPLAPLSHVFLFSPLRNQIAQLARSYGGRTPCA